MLYEPVNSAETTSSSDSTNHNIFDSAFEGGLSSEDAFQYFEVENGLNYIDSISFDDETSSSLSHIRKIKARIDKDNIQCLVYQAPKPAIVDTLMKQTAIKATALDPLGLNVSNDKNAWFEIMHQLALDFAHCLNP